MQIRIKEDLSAPELAELLERAEADIESLRQQLADDHAARERMEKQIADQKSIIAHQAALNESAHAHIALLKASIAQAERENDSLTGERDRLREAAQAVIDNTEIAYRNAKRDELEIGRMVRVRLHAIADLRAALTPQETEK